MSGGSVAELVQGMHDEATRGMVDVLSRYTSLVHKAVAGKMTQQEAVSAASIAYELGMPVDRFERDVATVKAERELVKQIEADEAAKDERTEQRETLRLRLKVLEQEIKETQQQIRRHPLESMVRASRVEDRNRLHATSPHLFKAADNLSDSEWQAVRSVLAETTVS
jgi:phage shock protein A